MSCMGPYLRRADQRARREGRREQVEGGRGPDSSDPSRPLTMCMMWPVAFNDAIRIDAHRTGGGYAPKSLRARSTSITCSAFSLGSFNSSTCNAASCASSDPRGRDPAIGRNCASPR